MVIVIIVILLSALLVGGTTVINNSRVKGTRAVMRVVQDAVDQFRADEPSIIKARQGPSGAQVRYQERYGSYPPDELEVFMGGIPGCTGAYCRSLAPGDAEVVITPVVPLDDMKFYAGATPEQEHRDLAAMILAIELYSEAGAAMLDRIPARHRTAGLVNPTTGLPNRFLDRDNNGSWTPGTDQQIRLIVDSWGVPLSYLTQRDYDPNEGADPTKSKNQQNWNQASTEMIALNGGQPILLSYGIDGKEQLTQTWMEDTGKASIVQDWFVSDGKLTDPLNEDNIYVDESLNDKLARGSIRIP